MKKLFRKVSGLLAVLAVSVICGCSDVIFDDIRKEVKLKEAQISGSINSIVRVQYNGEEYLLTQSGNKIYSKLDPNSSSSWKNLPVPSVSSDYKMVTALAADNSYVYAQVLLVDRDDDEGENIPEGFRLYCTDDFGENWSLISIDGSDTFSTGDGKLHLFCTNAPIASNRKAYARVYSSTTGEYTVYELDGTSPSALTTIQSDDSGLSDAYNTVQPTYNTKSCASFGGNVYFSPNYSITTDECAAYTEDGVDKPEVTASIMYYASGDNVSYTLDGTNWTTVDLDCGTIYSLAVTSDYLLLGTSAGIVHSKLENGVPAVSTTSFSTNAYSALSTYYTVRKILAVTPALPEYVSKNAENASSRATVIYGTTVYSGSSSSTSARQDYVGLWSYYPSTGEWNRE